MKSTVLIVDDDSNLLEGLRRILRREPYRLLTASSCEDALCIFNTTRVDLVISDQDMPGMSGTSFLKCIRERYPETIRFMLTGKATLDGAIEAINAGGISRFFLKPCDHVNLAVSIREGLQQQKLMATAYRLLQKNKLQSEILGRLERQFPDISKVERDADGAIQLEDFHGDIDRLLAEMCEYLEDAEPSELQGG